MSASGPDHAPGWGSSPRLVREGPLRRRSPARTLSRAGWHDGTLAPAGIAVLLVGLIIFLHVIRADRP